MTMFRVAGAQIDVQFADRKANLDKIGRVTREAASHGAGLVVFPECAVSGYCYESLAEAMPIAEEIPGESTKTLEGVCRETNCYIVTGMLEREGDRVFNSAVLVGPNGVVGSYRKIHLPYLGIDRFATPGDRPFSVFPVGPIRLGIHICYDGSFPESARVMTLDGADLIVLPTNWPPKSECAAEHLPNCRALENVIYFMAVDRVGEERGFQFIGGSRIAGPGGETIHDCPHTREEVFYADIDTDRSRQKRLIRVPGKHEIDRIKDRRPEMYGRIVEPVDASSNGGHT